MARFYLEKDGNLAHLNRKTVAVIGYGNQGHAHALNLRDSGIDVIVGQRKGAGYRRAVRDGFKPVSVSDAAERAGVIMMLVPDEVMADVYEENVRPGLRKGKVLAFAHGFNIRYGRIVPPSGVDVIMVSPKGPGRHLRSEFVAGRGLASLVAVHQDASRKALRIALAYAKAIGGMRACCIRTTFAEETEADLFGEQAVLCGGTAALIKAGFETLVEAGYQPEVAYFEVMHELSLIVELLAEGGLTHMRRAVSNTAEYGDLTRGPRIIGAAARKEMKRILAEVRSGAFAKEWIREATAASPKFKALEKADEKLLLEQVGRRLRELMK